MISSLLCAFVLFMVVRVGKWSLPHRSLCTFQSAMSPKLGDAKAKSMILKVRCRLL